MFVGASPDARLVSPWLGGHTPHSSCMLFQFSNIIFDLSMSILMDLIPIVDSDDDNI